MFTASYGQACMRWTNTVLVWSQTEFTDSVMDEEKVLVHQEVVFEWEKKI